MLTLCDNIRLNIAIFSGIKTLQWMWVKLCNFFNAFPHLCSGNLHASRNHADFSIQKLCIVILQDAVCFGVSFAGKLHLLHKAMLTIWLKNAVRFHLCKDVKHPFHILHRSFSSSGNLFHRYSKKSLIIQTVNHVLGEFLILSGDMLRQLSQQISAYLPFLRHRDVG